MRRSLRRPSSPSASDSPATSSGTGTDRSRMRLARAPWPFGASGGSPWSRRKLGFRNGERGYCDCVGELMASCSFVCCLSSLSSSPRLAERVWCIRQGSHSVRCWRIGINVNEMRVRRTVEEQLTRSFFPPLPRAKAKNSPPPFWMTVPSWLRPIATGISGSRPSLTTSPLWIFLVYSPGYAAKKVVKHHGRVSITPPRPLATPPALDFVPELDVLFHFRPVATDSSSILVGTCLGATVILFKEDEPGKKGPTTTRIFKLELRPKHRRFNQFQDPDFRPGRPMPWCFQPSTPPDGRRLSLHIDNLPYTACRRLMRRSEGRPGWRWGK